MKTDNQNIPAIDRNIAAVHNLRKSSDESRNLVQKFVDHVALFLSSTRSLYAHLIFYSACICLHFAFSDSTSNSYFTTAHFGTTASLEALFLAIFVLINQGRSNAIARKSSDLHLQVSLLAEYELTRLAQIADLTARHLGIRTDTVKGLDELKKDFHPDEILRRISEHEQKSPTDSTSEMLDKKKT